MSDNENSENSLTYQQETAQDMLCLCAIVLVVGVILVIAYFQDTEKKVLKAVVGGVLITLGAIPCLILCVCLQKMSDEAAETNQFESMCRLRAMQSINRLDGTISLHRFDGRLGLNRLESVEQDLPNVTNNLDTSLADTTETISSLPVPTITVTVAPIEESEEINTPPHLSSDSLSNEHRPPRRGSLFESVAEVMEVLSITR